MKRNKLLLLLLGFILGGIFCPQILLGETQTKQIEVNFVPFKLMFDREEKQPEKPIFLFEGSVYVPLRFFAESIGTEVFYDEDKKTIWVGRQLGDIPKNLVDFQPVYKSDSVVLNSSEKLFDGKLYGSGITFFNSRESVKYKLNGDAYYFSAILGPSINYSNSQESYIIITVDGKEVFRSPNFISLEGHENSLPQEIKINIEGAKELIIEKHGSTRLSLMEAKLWY